MNKKVGLFSAIIILFAIIFFTFQYVKRNEKCIAKPEQITKYSVNQKKEIKQIIYAIIEPEQIEFPPLLTFNKPSKIYISDNENLMFNLNNISKNDSISFKYLTESGFFNEDKKENLLKQNSLILKNYEEILQNINLSKIDSTAGTVTKVVSIPIINTQNNNAFVRVITLDTGHFLDTTDYWLEKNGNSWKIKKSEMIFVH